MAKKGGNPQNFNNPEKLFADQPLAVRVEVEFDTWVRSLPNKTEWLRKVITEAAKREMEQSA